MYVTLEPCSHRGVTAPCADAIVQAGLERVVCAIEDPDPRVAGRGLARLRQAGVAVERGLMAEPAHWLAAGHILRVTERRPLVTAKLALDAGGEVPRGSQGQPAWATGAAARARGHLLRARSDAILVGRRTVVDDDPLLTCRLPGLEGRSPVRIVLARELAGLEKSRLAQSARDYPLWVFCGADANTAPLTGAGADVIPTQFVGGDIWLPAVMEALVARGITRLLVEGGPATWTAFSRSGLIDEAVLFHARAPGGAEMSSNAAMAAAGRYISTAGFDLYDRRTIGSDDMLTMRRHWPCGIRRGRSEAT
jgi:diaminohydroxyphosphoribosylaminopyrimidine deaminase/5-amino-6-(5-phosphoribosylamino)uracil reductase